MLEPFAVCVHSNRIAKIFNLRPFTVTVLPALRPIKAMPIGLSSLMRPALGSTSWVLTIVNSSRPPKTVSSFEFKDSRLERPHFGAGIIVARVFADVAFTHDICHERADFIAFDGLKMLEFFFEFLIAFGG
jgi:hypothetical protein